jgi:hypothetical protein
MQVAIIQHFSKQQSEYTMHVSWLLGIKTFLSGMTIPANVSVLYNRSYAEIRDLYARAQLVVIVSKDEQVADGSDCSGQTVILDALAAGRRLLQRIAHGSSTTLFPIRPCCGCT